jgi:hypothetical protein
MGRKRERLLTPLPNVTQIIDIPNKIRAAGLLAMLASIPPET